MSRSSHLKQLLRGEVSATDLATRYGVSIDEVHAWRDLYLDGLEAGHARRASHRRLRAAFTGLGLLLAVGVGLGGSAALSQACSTPALYTRLNLKFMCAGAPARATDVNANTERLAALMEEKLGPVGNGNAHITPGRVNATAYTPVFARWSDPGTTGNGGAGIVNDDGTYKKLMVVGSTAGGGVRQVGLWDDVSVAGNLSVVGALSFGSLGSLACRGASTACNTYGDLAFLDRHNVTCASTEFLQRFQQVRCDANNFRYDYTCCKLGT